MSIRYPCIVLDHDDTSVESTALIHYPAHVEVMRIIRPHMVPVDLDTWFVKNFHPGISAYLTGELEFSEDELQAELKIWRSHTARTVPSFFPGFLDLLAEYRRRGGIITVVSHSEEEVIRRHYLKNQELPGFMPDLIFGWCDDETRRKPHPWPVEQVIDRFGFDASEILIVDDLKPGALMAEAAGADFAAAGWGHDIPEIRAYMEKRSLAYFQSVADFRDFLLVS